MSNELLERQTQKIRGFTDLNAWKEAYKFTLMVYQITKKFPKEEMFGLVSQMRRCAVSIASNIAEGFSRQTYGEKIQFYGIAQGSLTELQNQLLIAKGVDIIDEQEFDPIYNQSTEVHKVLTGLIKKSKDIRDS